jgi:leishmanolysin
MIHVLGFSPSLYNFFREKPIISTQYGRTTIQTPTLNAWMKSHFNCGIGAPLEDEGSDGSVGAHWERSVFQD